MKREFGEIPKRSRHCNREPAQMPLRFWEGAPGGELKSGDLLDFRGQRAKRPCLHGHSAAVAGVKYSVAEDFADGYDLRCIGHSLLMVYQSGTGAAV